MQNKLLLFSVLLLCVFTKGKSETDVSGIINTNTTWTTAGSPYILTGSLEVQLGITLTIQPGVTVERTTRVQMIIDGILNCAGTQADSIYFNTSDVSDISTPPFLQFQKTDLSNSTLRFLSFKSISPQTGNIRLGGTNESAALIKNSGILNIERSSFRYGNLVTRGYYSAISMNLDSCSIDSCGIQSGASSASNSGSLYYSEKINVYNSTISNASEVTNSYSFGIMDSNCVINNVTIQGSSNTTNTVIASTLDNSSFNVNGSILNISRSSMSNTPIFGVPGGGSVNIDASKFSTDNPDTAIYPRSNGVSYLIQTSQATITNTSFTGIPEVDAIIIQGLNSSDTNTIAHNSFSGFGDAVTVSSFVTQPNIDSNNFYSVKMYDIINYSPKDFSAVYDYYMLTSGQQVSDLIFDHNDNPIYGYVFYIPYANDSILPLHLISFTGAYSNSQVLLKWQTANEVNSARFVVQHFVNGSYQDIGTVTAKGGSSNSYSFAPASIANGTNIYRLKMIDNDGKYTYSNSISITVSGLAMAFTIYPNPAAHYVLISHAKAETTSQLQLTDLNGRIIKSVVVAAGDIQNKIVVDGLAKGTYKVIWRNGTSTQSQTVLVQ